MRKAVEVFLNAEPGGFHAVHRVIGDKREQVSTSQDHKEILQKGLDCMSENNVTSLDIHDPGKVWMTGPKANLHRVQVQLFLRPSNKPFWPGRGG